MKKKYKKKQIKYGTGRGTKRYNKWRQSILIRSNYKCEKCCKEHEKLHCHHIVSWNKDELLRYDIDNGIVLCPSCHIKEGLKSGEINPGEHLKGKPSWNKGKPWSIEARKKMSLTRKGRQSAFKGKIMSEESKRKISESKKGIPWTENRRKAQDLKKGLCYVGPN